MPRTRWNLDKIIFCALICAWFTFFSRDAYCFLYVASGSYNNGARPVSAGLVWSTKKFSIKLNTDQQTYPSSSLTPAISQSQWIAAVTAAVKAWADACKADLTVELSGTTSLVADSNDGVNTITWDARTQGNGNQFGANTSTLAWALPAPLSDNSLSDCDIAVNGNFSGTFGVDGESTKYDLVSTLTHEIGHCLSLDHPIDPYNATPYTSTNSILNTATMVQTAVAGIGSTFRRTINQDDIDGVTCLYPRSGGFRSGTPCNSYHGTNGGAAISGVVSGGPSSESALSCGTDRDAVTVSAKQGSTGGGCITDALANEAMTIEATPENVLGSAIGEFAMMMGTLALARVPAKVRRKRRNRKRSAK